MHILQFHQAFIYFQHVAVWPRYTVGEINFFLYLKLNLKYFNKWQSHFNQIVNDNISSYQANIVHKFPPIYTMHFRRNIELKLFEVIPVGILKIKFRASDLNIISL